MPDRMTTSPMTAEQRGSIGGRVAAQRMTPEQRSERARLGSRMAAVSTIEKHWDDMPEELRARVLARVSG
jgi:hypothetical protein